MLPCKDLLVRLGACPPKRCRCEIDTRRYLWMTAFAGEGARIFDQTWTAMAKNSEAVSSPSILDWASSNFKFGNGAGEKLFNQQAGVVGQFAFQHVGPRALGGGFLSQVGDGVFLTGGETDDFEQK